ncbi:helix-turn-helix domain-containing protein [Metabacillus litoralis]|uniref:helix-turn-helix domain-containing protein n=1 Tax=Metabacillus litoralis TaxID=152268 RepID=UPI00203DB73A|nr:helix-turn-helix transcriptional regulator [Metabacillus litoralis]MCM3411495.1 helix-turn-helix domain-containing protein [Metabacillus litoralis]
MSVQEKLRSYIESNGIKLNFVAEKSDIPLKKFYRLINGDSTLSVEDFEKICIKGLSKDPSFFLNETSQK